MSMWTVAISISLIKTLLIPAYRSTDFEVHRNWLAVTHSLPISEWYTDETSEWTLDYPPLFAWFEWLLSFVAYYFDPEMLEVSNLNYASEMTIVFQRLSVILMDFVLAYGLIECIREVKKVVGERLSDLNLVFLLTFANAGLVLVDHIHFQYNGFLFGIMFISIARILQGKELEGALWFSILLNLKHIYLYIAPAYFLYLLRSYCFSSKADKSIDWKSFAWKRLLGLISVVSGVFLVSFGPFLYLEQFSQVMSRLFPFKRGLCHAFWAPNFWALYNFIDKILSHFGVMLGFETQSEIACMTGGLVQEYEHAILPSISPLITFVLTLLLMLPCLWTLWKYPHSLTQFVRVLTMCGFCSYLVGWHVHEKAILMVVLPLGLLSLISEFEAKHYTTLNIVANFSLFPLIYTPQETVIKVSLLLLHAMVVSSFIEKYWNVPKAEKWCHFIPLLNCVETLYLLGFIPLFIYEQCIHKLLDVEDSLPFLPLMMISVYCSLGVLYSWFSLYRIILSVARGGQDDINRGYSIKGHFTVREESAEKKISEETTADSKSSAKTEKAKDK